MRNSGLTLFMFLITTCATLPGSKAQNGTKSKKPVLKFRIQAFPSSIDEGTTEESEVRCDYFGPSTLVSIGIVKTSQTSKDVKTLAHVALNQPKQLVFQNGIKAEQTSGEIKADGQSGYLSIKWSTPSQHQEGWYTCQVVAVVGYGQFVKSERSVRVRVNEMTVASLLRIVGLLKKEVSTLKGEVGSVNGQVGTLQGQVGSVKGKVGSVSSELGSLKGQVGTLNSKIGSVKGEVGSVKGQVATLQGQVGSVKGEIGSVKGTVGSVSSELGSVKGQVDTLNSKVGSVKGQVGTLNSKVESVKGQVEALQGQVGSMKGEIGSVKGQVGSVKGEIGSVKGQVRSMKGDMTIVKKFLPSKRYYGRTYYLKMNMPVTQTRAQVFCQGLGGYLAEIDNRAEYNFVVGFVANLLSNNHLILIGGSDSVHEGTWVFHRTNKHVPFMKWAPGQPDNAGGNEDCMCLWNINNRFHHMNDLNCDLSVYRNRWELSILCEVPE